jgi:membrane protease YdiL (CAAX protease family)
MLDIGAGYFEELIFRVIIYGGLYTAVLYTAKKIKPEKELRVFKVFTMIIIGVISSFLFSLAHHLAGEPFSVYAFWYRAISGMIFVVLFELRGFGIAAYTHAFYDIWVG